MISYHKETREWVADKLEPEEVERLVEIGKEELIRLIALQLFRQMMPNAEEVALNAIPAESMGHA